MVAVCKSYSQIHSQKAGSQCSVHKKRQLLSSRHEKTFAKYFNLILFKIKGKKMEEDYDDVLIPVLFL